METKKCTKCGEVKALEMFRKSKNGKFGVRGDCKICSSNYQRENQERRNKQQKERYQRNKKEFNRKRREYRKKNKEAISEYWKHRYETDELFRLTVLSRGRMTKIFLRKKYSKNESTKNIIGLEWEELKLYIEAMFTEGMTWENYGSEWHIDHIYPLSRAKNEEHLKELCHYSNLQPLWAEDNLSKGNKIL